MWAVCPGHHRKDGNSAYWWGERPENNKKHTQLDDEWPESIFHHVGSQSVSYLLSVQCEVFKSRELRLCEGLCVCIYVRAYMSLCLCVRVS